MNILNKIKRTKKDPGVSNKNFFDVKYQLHNIARLSHLNSLDLDLNNKKVLELGAGIGDHTLFYLYKGCVVTPIEGRQELCDFILKRFDIRAEKVDFEYESEKLSEYSNYDVVHCYGLLYHLSNPVEFLKHACNTGNVFLLETCVSTDDAADPINIVNENINDGTQAISGKGCRPTRKWLFDELKKYYSYVYLSITQPRHKEFPLDLRNKLSEDQLTRAIFIASNNEINNAKLVQFIPDLYL
ncbi:MAG: methyltransferase domain-containing protein [Bacteroidota bacterium]|nr:methyltransferase domain-containing protein [Bacteroidota bacterium]